MGVLNITPDSFSDGGLYLETSKAVSQANKLLSAGADIIDIGGQSTRPGAEYVNSEEEIQRILPALKLFRNENKLALISIDTFNSSVAEKAIEEGANWINDISGGRIDENIMNVVAEAKCPFVINHSRGISSTMKGYSNYKDVVKEVFDELNNQTELAISKGILPNNIIWDPGIGFAKEHHHNIEIIRNLECFVDNEFPVMLGPSRKSFIGHYLNSKAPNDRLFGTVAVVCRCAHAKVNLVRVHDVEEISKVLLISDLIWQ